MTFETWAIEGDLELRRLRGIESEYRLLSRWLSDERVLQFYEGRDHPFTLEKARAKFAPEVRLPKGERPGFIVWKGVPVGYIQFYRIEGEERSLYSLPEGGIVFGMDLFIGNPDLWGRGLGKRAVHLMLAYLFEQQNADWVVLDPQADNLRAIATYERCGFRKIKIAPRMNCTRASGKTAG